MIRAGKALMFSRGFLPAGKNSHKTITEFTEDVLGPQYQDLIMRFNRMRRKRHDFIYDSLNHTTETEVRTAIKTARELIGRIEALIPADKTGKIV
jgi:hypothetical protein